MKLCLALSLDKKKKKRGKKKARIKNMGDLLNFNFVILFSFCNRRYYTT